MSLDREIRNVKGREQNGVEMEKDESVFDFFQEDGEWKSMEEISDSGNGEKYANVHRNKNKTKG